MRLILPGIALILFLCAASVQADDNAAEIYKQAIAAVPAEPPDIEVYKSEHPATEAVQGVLKRGENALAQLHKATGVENCDWGVDATDPKMDVSFLKNLRLLDELSYLKVDSDMAGNQTVWACDALIDRMMIGVRVQKIHVAVAFILGNGCEESAAVQAAAWLPQMDDTGKKKLADAVTKLDPTAGETDVIANETKAFPQQFGDKQKLSIHNAVVRTSIKLAMLQAALASDGTEASFASSKDPTDAQPFSYLKTPGGYEVSSRAVYKGKPITLTIGKQG